MNRSTEQLAIESVLEQMEQSLTEDYNNKMIGFNEYEIRIEAIKDCLYAIAYSVDSLYSHLRIWDGYDKTECDKVDIDSLVYSDMLNRVREMVGQ